MGVRHRFEFDTQFGDTDTVEILDSQYSSSVNQMKLSRDEPYKLSQRDAGYDNLHVRSTFCDLNIEKASEDLFELIQGTSKGRFKIRIERNGSLFYEAEVEPTLVKKEDDFGPTSYTISGTDLSKLKDSSPFYGSTGPPTVGNSNNKISVLEVLDDIIGELGASNFSTVVNLIHAQGDSTSDPLGEYGFWYNFKNKDDSFKNYSHFSVLKQVCKRFNLTFTWTEGNVYMIEEWTDKNGIDKTRYNYTQGGPVLDGSTSYTQTKVVDDQNVQIEPDISWDTQKRAKSVNATTRNRIEADFFDLSFLDKPNFKTFLGWTTPNTFENATVEYDIPRDAVTVDNNPGSLIVNPDPDQSKLCTPDDVAANLTTKQPVSSGAKSITIESEWMQKDSANEFDVHPRNLWKSNRSDTQGWGYEGDPAAHAFKVAFDDNLKLALMEVQCNSTVGEKGENQLDLSLPSTISPNNTSDPNYASGVTVFPEGHILMFPWAKVELLEDFNEGDFSVKCKVNRREYADDEKNAWDILDRNDKQDPLIPSGEYAYTGGWVETTNEEFLVFPAVNNGGDHTAVKFKLPAQKPSGEDIKSDMQVEVRGNVMRAKQYCFKMDVRPSTDATEYTVREPTGEQPAEFREGDEDPREFDLGEFFIGTSPRLSRASVIDMDTGDPALDWGNGLILEKRVLVDLLERANQPTNRIQATIRSDFFGPEKVLSLDGEEYLPTQLELNPAEGVYKGSFLKVQGNNLNWTFEDSEEQEDSDGGDDSVEEGSATIVKPSLGADAIAEYLESEKDRLRLSGDLITFDGNSVFNGYLRSDDYNGDLPDSNGVIADNGTTGFMIKDGYLDSNGNPISGSDSESEIIITNGIFRGKLDTNQSISIGTIEDNLDIQGTFLTMNSDFTGSNPSKDVLFQVNRGSKDKAVIKWDENNDEWVVGTGSNLSPIGTENFQLGPQLEYDSVNFDPKRLEIIQGDGSGLNADKVDGFSPGGSTGDIPINNSNLMTDLNADKLDGKDAATIISEAGVDVDLNADSTEDITPANLITIFGDTTNVFQQGDTNELEINVGAQWPNADQVDGKDASNNSGDVPVSNGQHNQNLNADQLDGYEGQEVAIRAENETISGEWTHTSRLILDGTTLRTQGAATGFAGSGTIIDDQESWFDDLQIRGSLIARTFEIRQIRVSKGETMFSPGGGKIESVTGNGPWTLTFSEKPGITTSDLLLIKEASIDDQGSRSLIKDLELNVDSVSADGKTIDVSANSGISSPEKGDDVVVVGSSDTSRDSSLFASPYIPALDVLDGINTFSEWNNRTPKARLGDISGMPSISGTSPTGHGLWSQNVYLEGTIRVTEGEITDTVTVGGNQAQDLETITGAQNKADSAESDSKNYADNLDSALRNDLQTTFEDAVANGETVIDGGVIATDLVTLDSVVFSPVESDNVIGSINSSPEGINIDANNLNIGANTTFLSSDYDPSTKTPKTDGGVVIRNNTPPDFRPSGDSLQEGDVWIDTNNGDKPHTWNGTGWIEEYTAINGGDITTGTIDAARISLGYADINDPKPPSDADNTQENTAQDIVNLPDSPAGEGFYADGQQLGFWNNSEWTTYIESTTDSGGNPIGQFYVKDRAQIGSSIYMWDSQSVDSTSDDDEIRISKNNSGDGGVNYVRMYQDPVDPNPYGIQAKERDNEIFHLGLKDTDNDGSLETYNIISDFKFDENTLSNFNIGNNQNAQIEIGHFRTSSPERWGFQVANFVDSDGGQFRAYINENSLPSFGLLKDGNNKFTVTTDAGGNGRLQLSMVANGDEVFKVDEASNLGPGNSKTGKIESLYVDNNVTVGGSITVLDGGFDNTQINVDTVFSTNATVTGLLDLGDKSGSFGRIRMGSGTNAFWLGDFDLGNANTNSETFTLFSGDISCSQNCNNSDSASGTFSDPTDNRNVIVEAPYDISASAGDFEYAAADATIDVRYYDNNNNQIDSKSETKTVTAQDSSAQSSGNITITKSSAPSDLDRIEVDRTVNADENNGGNSDATIETVTVINSTSEDFFGPQGGVWRRGGVERVAIDPVGDAFTESTSGEGNVISDNFPTWSDRRIKTDIQGLSEPLDKVNALQPKIYRKSENGKRHLGFIAQDLNDIIPEIVQKGGENQRWSYRPQEMHALTVGAIQEVDSELQKAKKKITKLEKELERLKDD